MVLEIAVVIATFQKRMHLTISRSGESGLCWFGKNCIGYVFQ